MLSNKNFQWHTDHELVESSMTERKSQESFLMAILSAENAETPDGFPFRRAYASEMMAIWIIRFPK